ncbi:PGF-CTERM sorting domain-containing protein [Haloglomus litoreum]|uniref:PGF-CTERM sorting domain-containing protein n=1 Tax=Haloglomus litoreum TaxID=3034026 RepID=UPI0023E7F2D2|nr:PGF-CTERM sorting domain-containing protein [Haloglomus sp. DT116]
MPSSTSAGVPGQRPRHRLTAPTVALLAVLAVVAPLAAPAVADTGGTAPTTRDAASPHENVTGGNLTRLVGPGASYGALDEFGDVATAHRSGALEMADEVELGDTLVLAFRSERLGAEYADTVGPNASVRFFGALEQTNASLNVTSVSGTDCGPLRVDLRASRHRVLANDTRGAFRVLLDTEGLVAEGGCDGRLEVPGRYEVTLELPAENETRQQTAQFSLLGGLDDAEPEPEPDERIPVYRAAPSLADDLRTAGELRRGIRGDRLERSEMVVPDEVAVVRLRSARLDRAYANASGANATQRLLRAANATGGSFAIVTERVRLTSETAVRSGARPGVVLLGPGVRTVADRGNDTFFVVLDTGRARLRTGNGTVPLAADPETTLRPSLTVPGGEPERYVGRLIVRPLAGSIAVARNASVDGARQVAVIGTDGVFVARVGSNLAVGSALTLRVRADGETLARRTVRVDRERADRPEGDPDATFDLGTQPAGRRLNLTLAQNGTTFHSMTVLVGQRPTLRDATARRVRGGPEGSTVRFGVTARFPAPGYVVVQNRSGRYVGFPVRAGEPVRVNGTVRIRERDDGGSRPVQLIAVYDSNGNGRFDGPRTSDEIDLPFQSDEGGILVQTVRLPPPSPTPTVTAPPPGTTIAVDEGQPGFGPLVALLGMLGVVCLLGARRGRGGSS